MIKMRFKTLSEYDYEIKKIDKMIDNWEKYIKTHPEEIGGHTNCEGLKYVRNELKKERDNLEFQSNEYKDDFDLVGVRKHPNQPLHHYLQLKR